MHRRLWGPREAGLAGTGSQCVADGTSVPTHSGTAPQGTGARPACGSPAVGGREVLVGSTAGAGDRGPARTDELHGRPPQVPVGVVEVVQGLHEELVIAAQVALHLGGRGTRAPVAPPPLRPGSA